VKPKRKNMDKEKYIKKRKKTGRKEPKKIIDYLLVCWNTPFSSGTSSCGAIIINEQQAGIWCKIIVGY
jgi:hypothetical protein